MPDQPCFEPCGGNPFGTWQLEGACFAARRIVDGTCDATQAGVDMATSLKLDIRAPSDAVPAPDTLFVEGSEAWSFTTQYLPVCVPFAGTPAEQCAQLRSSPTATLFSDFTQSMCPLNSCGLCECGNQQSAAVSVHTSHQLVENTLVLGNGMNIPYCVTAIELWIGGGDDVAYVFRRL